MKLEKYEKLKQKLEVLKLEKNYSSLNTTLYYFSFLGNVFLIYFGYFFIKTITDSLPDLFPYQNFFFTIFIALFLTGYEFTKRFVLQQTASEIITGKKFTLSLGIAGVVSAILIAGSFYLSLNGAHRLVDNTQIITQSVTTTTNLERDSISKYWEKEIAYYRSQPGRKKADRLYRDSIVASLVQKKDIQLEKIDNKSLGVSETVLDRNKENDTAFLFMTFFLEMIIIIGVAFNAYYTIGSYQETTKLLQTPKYKQYIANLKLLSLYYNNGKKIPGNPTLSVNKLVSLVKAQKLPITNSEVRDFIILCGELDIIEEVRNRRKQYKMTYNEALEIMRKDDLL